MILDSKKTSDYLDHQDPIYSMDHYHCIEIDSKFELFKSSFYIPYDPSLHQSKQDIYLLNNIYAHNNLLCKKNNTFGYYYDDKFIAFQSHEQEIIKNNLLKLLMNQFTI